MKSTHARWTRSPLLFALCLVAAGSACADDPSASFDPWSQAATYEVTWRVDLPKAAAGQPWRLWVAVPAEMYDQHVTDADIDAPVPFRMTRDDLDNRYLVVEGEGAPPPGRLVATFTVGREVSRGIPATEAHRGGPDDPNLYLKPQKKIPLEGIIADRGRKVAEGHEKDGDKIRAFYDYVSKQMTYSKHGKGWGQGDAVWACTSKYGNCTDFHSLLIGMARSQRVPARFLMGFPIPADREAGTAVGYHCWSQAFDRASGWVPMDASEASKSKRFDDYYGRLPSDRVLFSMGRDLVLEPAQQGEPLNYFIHPYAEIAGQAAETPLWELAWRRVPNPAPPAAGGR